MRTRTGSRRIVSASRSMGSGIVAEKRTVCRRAGSLAITRRTSGMKPMSSIRSASSSTKISIERKSIEPLAHQVDQPAGRGDEDLDALSQGPGLRALADAAEDHRVPQAGVASVGAEALADLRRPVRGSGRAREPGWARRAALRSHGESLARRCRMGSAKAAVLPVPVWRNRAGRGRPSVAGNRLGLDGGGGGVTFGGDGAKDGLGKAEFCKSHSRSFREGPRTRCDERKLRSQKAIGTRQSSNGRRREE